MEFKYYTGDTIAAIATAPGEGGVAIIRISGQEALHVAAKVFSGPVFSFASHTAHYGKILNAAGEKIDDVLLIPFLGKRSYTGEDTVEIFCHGGSLITRRVLEQVLKAGARMAQPGEFTFKAFINGKMDLAQAEAVQELIAAKNEKALDAAENQLKGALSEKIRSFQERLAAVAAILEAWVDFPEEGLEFASMEEVAQELETVCAGMQQLHNTFHDGKMIHEGLALCLVGSPNVGKSSLMNALLDKERAIVSHLPGTTRDILEDHIRLNGLNFRLLDTAGIRDTDEIIEKEGIRRSKKAIAEADLILLVLDASRRLEESDKSLLAELPKAKTIAVWNKIDLGAECLELNHPSVSRVSALKRIGLEELKQMIDRLVWQNGPPERDEIVLTNVRHKEALLNAIDAVQIVLGGLKNGTSPEFLTSDLRSSLKELGKVIGLDVGETIISAIFSKFCIGK